MLVLRVELPHPATGGLLSVFSQSWPGWLTHQAADREYLLQTPAGHSEELLVLESLCKAGIWTNKMFFSIAFVIKSLLLQQCSIRFGLICLLSVRLVSEKFTRERRGHYLLCFVT